LEKILVTGGAGFIGSNFVKLYQNDYDIVVVDNLTYASNLPYLKQFKHTFIKGDVRDYEFIHDVILCNKPSVIVNYAAETHVDNSIRDPMSFAQTNVFGLCNIVETMRLHDLETRLIHISTDEVYGSTRDGLFSESSNISPSSPYSATKAASDHIALAYHRTYGLDIIVTNCTNNYGPNQHKEKLIPTIIRNMLESKPIPVYGDGQNVRDWIHVDDHNYAIRLLIDKGEKGHRYNIGCDNQVSNIRLVEKVCDYVQEVAGIQRSEIRYVEDRKGHDFRYAVDSSKLRSLGWMPRYNFDRGLRETVEWYCR
jgi:dTDP-glucose 4,6-dehydratase